MIRPVNNGFALAANQCVRNGAVYTAGNGPSTRIPQRTTVAKMTPAEPNRETNILSVYVEKWKNRYEDAERKHKTSLLRNEKARRDHEDLTRRHNILIDEKSHLESELKEREKELNKLRLVSERLFNEYQQLKQQHEVDAGVMQKVMQQAGEWYKQNKQLKRRSTVLFNALPTKPKDLDLTDSLDTGSDSNEEIEFLKQTVSELSKQLAESQSELNNVKLQEFEAHEQNSNLIQELETEKTRVSELQTQLLELTLQLERHERVSKLLMEELTRFKENADNDKEIANNYKSEALQANKRVRVLTHQSALLMSDVTADERTALLLQEVDKLKEDLEQVTIKHQAEVEELQLKLTEKHEDIDIILWEEKIRLAEDDAKQAKLRAETAERRLAELSGGNSIAKRRQLFEKNETKVEKVEMQTESSDISTVASIPPPPPITGAPPPPPPPMGGMPPPPPPPPNFNLGTFDPMAGNSEDMATLLANKQNTLKKTKANSGTGIDAIVDQIKGGKFQLKSTEQNFLEKKQKVEQPEAVKEMLAILGTLRKRRSRTNFVTTVDSQV